MISEIKKIIMRDGTTIHADIVECGSPIWLVMTHGLGEHCERHFYLHKLFSQYFNICIYDLRGHGKSEGKRAYVESFGEFTDDLGEVLNFLKETYSMNKYMLMGHSMGGLITSSYMQNKVDHSFYPEKVFLSSPVAAVKGAMGKVFSVSSPKLLAGLTNIPLSMKLGGLVDLSKLSHDPRVQELYVTDQYNCLKIHTKLIFEMIAEARNVFSRPLRLNCDGYCSIGTLDGLVESSAVIDFFESIEKNVKLNIVKNGFHELHNEVEKYRTQHFDFLKESLMNSIYE